MVRRPLRIGARVVLMMGVAFAPAVVACAQANDPFGAPPAAAPPAAAPAAAPPPTAAPPAATAPGAPTLVRSDAPTVRAAEEGPFSAAAASVGLRTHSLAEEKILHALEDKTECDFTETPLADVLDYFKSKHEIEIQGDKKALQEEAVDASQPITRSLKGVKLKSALRMILGEVNLTYIIRDEVLMITTKTEADALAEIRTYPVHDLLTQWPAGTLRGRDLVRMITAVVQPTTWDENGGPGAVELLPGTLVISQTQAVHEEIADLLVLLRRTRKAQAAEQATNAGHAAASDGKAAAKSMRVAVYHVRGVDSAGLRDSIISLIAPQTWKENGGEGSIQLIRGVTRQKTAEEKHDKPTPPAARAAPVRTAQFGGGSGGMGGGTDGGSGGLRAGGGAAGGGENVPTAQPTDLLVVRQTDDVHDAIEELMDDIYRATGGGSFCGGTGEGRPNSGSSAGGAFFGVRP